MNVQQVLYDDFMSQRQGINTNIVEILRQTFRTLYPTLNNISLWTGKPSRYVTSQLGRLNLLPSVGR